MVCARNKSVLNVWNFLKPTLENSPPPHCHATALLRPELFLEAFNSDIFSTGSHIDCWGCIAA